MGEKSSKLGTSGFGIDISLIPNANDSTLEKSMYNNPAAPFSQGNQQRQHVRNLLSTKTLISTINKKQGQSPSYGQQLPPKTPYHNSQQSGDVTYEPAKYKYITSNIPDEYMAVPIRTHSPMRTSGTLLVSKE